jgi:putative addiction module component (TIGR02574 family)
VIQAAPGANRLDAMHRGTLRPTQHAPETEYNGITIAVKDDDMSDLVQHLGKEARKLSPAERIRLVDEILSSLDQADPSLDAKWAAEAEDRIAAYRRGELKAVELSEVVAKYTTK